jgi:hypothetical protein
VQGQKKILLRGTDDILVVGLHMVGKRVKVSSLNNVTALQFMHLSLDSSLSYLSCHSSSLFFFFFLFHSLIHIFFSLIFIFLSFFSIHIFFLYSSLS